MIKRVLVLFCIVCGVLSGCASQQQSKAEPEDMVSAEQSQTAAQSTEPTAQQTSVQSEKTPREKVEEMFGLAPIDTIIETDLRKELEQGKVQVQQEDVYLAESGVIPSPEAVAFQAQITPGQPLSRDQADEEPIAVGLNFDNADIYDVTKVVSEITGKSFIIDQDVAGTVTIFSETPMTPDQIFELYKAVLDLNGLAIVQIGKFYKIENQERASKDFLIEDSGTRLNQDDRLVTQIIKLKSIRAENVKIALEALVPEGREIVVYPDENGDTLIITDLAANVKKILAIIEQIDVSRYADQYFEIFPIIHADIEDLVNDLTQILSLRETVPTTPAVSPPIEAPGVAEPVAEPTAVPRPVSQIVPPGTRTRLYPVTRLNALVVSTNQADVIALVRKWIDILDQPSKVVQVEDPDTIRTYVYPVQYHTAEELTPLLVEVYGSDQQPDVVIPEEEPEQIELDQAFESDNQQPNGPVPIFIPEPSNNSIIIKATPRQYANITTLLEKLDKRPLQVLVDVIFGEVQLQDTDIFGVQGMIIGQGQVSLGGETNSVETTTEAIFQNVIPIDSEGFRFVAAAPGRFLMQLRALATENKFKVLSDPHILVRNNETATINIGDEIPISETTGTGDNLRQNIRYRNTGISVEVTPRINANGDVVMDIAQEVSDVGQESFGDTGAASFTTRNTVTSVVTKDNHPIIMGGLMSDRGVDSQQGVPLLKDIPGLGKLFRYDEQQSRRQELIILVTPRVVRDPDEGWTLTENVLTERIRRLEEFFNREDTDADRVKRFIKTPITR